MSTVSKLKGTGLASRRWLIDVLASLCKENPLTVHCYAVYYLMREPDRTEIVLMASGDSIESYALVWYGGNFTISDIYEVHIWNPTREVVLGISIPPDRRVDIQLYDNAPSDVELVTSHFRSLGFSRFHIEEFHDMVCTHESFTPSPLEKLAVRLEERYASLYRDLELERGIEISFEEAREILKTYIHYGVIVDNVLVSIAASYVTLPWIYMIGGVFTRERYRGRGYAKAVTSALTREAVFSEAIAGLHVEVDNEPAIKVYKNLGYQITKTRTWVFTYP